MTSQLAPPAEVARALAAAAAIGPFFAPGTAAAGPGWRPAAALYPDGFVAGARRRLPEAEPRVAASIAQQGYAARLWSPVLAAGLLAGIVPDLAGLQLRDQEAAPLELALPRAAGWRAADPAALADLSYRVVVTAHLEPLASALAGQLADGLLWGNAASALTGALGVLARARPDLRQPVTTLAATLLARGRLADTGQLGVTGDGLGFRRRSCCLYYRLPGGGLCGDCGLTGRPARL
ncbi:MAG TPA: (2Fe-2S)-binding protein [Streptosporangiaceae bacterium]|nr:(2Fe-2S)-binding protein [Streptosporangiaceae bacterium]